MKRWISHLGVVTCAYAVLLQHPHRAQLPDRPSDPGAWLGWLAANPPDDTVATCAAIAGCVLVGWLVVATVLAALAETPGVVGRSARRLALRLTPPVLRQLLMLTLGGTMSTAGLTPAAASTPWPALDWPDASPPPVTAPALRPPGPDRPVVVAPGDCLWRIAARDLGPAATAGAVSAAWPRWYAANRAVIGPDPDLLQPGMRLVPPA